MNNVNLNSTARLATPPPRGNVLVIADDPVFMMDIRLSLMDEGYGVEECHDIDVLCQLAGTGRKWVSAIVDIGLSSVEAVRYPLQCLQNQQIPHVIIADDTVNASATTGSRRGFLSKPFCVDQLVSMLSGDQYPCSAA